MKEKIKKFAMLDQVITFAKKYITKSRLLLTPFITLIFYTVVSFRDLGKLDLNYMTLYFIDSLSFSYIGYAIKEGYVIRLLSFGINIFLIGIILIVIFPYLYKLLSLVYRSKIKARMTCITNKTTISTANKYPLMVIVIFMLIGLKADLDYMSQSGNIDLRERIVGVRSAMKGYNPYFFKWNLEMPVELLDPIDYINRSYRDVSRLTITPTALIMHMPFSNILFSQTKAIWFCIEYVSFLVIAFILVKLLSKTNEHGIIILIMMVLFSITYAWRIHMERGQIYVIYALISSLFIVKSLNIKTQKDIFVSGFFLALLISLRPTFIVFLIPLAIFKKIKLARATILSGVVIFILTTMLLGVNIWSQYFSGVSSSRGYWEISEEGVAVPQTKRIELRGVLNAGIEGVKDMENFISIKPTDSSMRTSLLYLFNIKVEKDTFRNIAIVTTVFVSILLFRERSKNGKVSLEHILIIGYGLQMFIDWLMPIPRPAYADVMILSVLALIIYTCSDSKDFLINKFGWIPLLGMLLGTSLINTDSFINSKYTILVGQFLIYMYIVGYSIYFVKKLFVSDISK